MSTWICQMDQAQKEGLNTVCSSYQPQSFPCLVFPPVAHFLLPSAQFKTNPALPLLLHWTYLYQQVFLWPLASARRFQSSPWCPWALHCHKALHDVTSVPIYLLEFCPAPPAPQDAACTTGSCYTSAGNLLRIMLQGWKLIYTYLGGNQGNLLLNGHA